MLGWRALTLGRLATMLAQDRLTEEGLAPVGSLSLEALCARAVSELAREGRLGRYAGLADTPGLPRAIARTLFELRLADWVPPPELETLAKAYEQLLGETRLADRALVLRYAAQVAREGTHPLVGLPTLLLDVRVRNVLEQALVSALVARSDEVVATVPEGDERSLARIEVALGVAATRLDNEDASPLRRLQRHLFAGTTPPQGTLGDELVIFSAPGEDRECVEIARHILRAANRGVAFDRMVILLRAPGSYLRHLEEALGRARIPVYFASGVREPDPSGRALLALLACSAEGLSARRFAEYLSLSEVPDADPAGAPPPARAAPDRWVPPDEEVLPASLDDEAAIEPATETAVSDPDAAVVAGSLRAPYRWERVIVEAAVIGGLDRWRRRLDGLRGTLELDLASLDDPEDPWANSIRTRLTDLEHLRKYALPLLETLESLHSPATWGVWIERLSAIATRALRHPDRVLAVLAELNPMGPVGPVGLREVRLVLSRRLTELVRLPTSRPYGRVFVAPVEGARGLVFDVVFVPGLAEKIFPQKVSEDPILRDEQREIIGGGLATNESRISDERFALRIAAGAARQRLLLSFPRLDLELGRPRVPSFYGLEVLRAAEGHLPGFEDLLRRAERAGEARIGWPAPPLPADAIDESEYDLAVLDQILRRPSEETTGMARYLLEANPHLARALRFRADRWRRKWTSADGLVDPSPPGQQALQEHLLARRSYSATQLQHFSACPYRFYLSAIQTLSPREEPQAIEELDPLQKGSLVHEVLSRLLTRLRDEGMLPITAKTLETARRTLDQVLEPVVARYHDDLAPAIERVWSDTVASVKADLIEMLQRAAGDASGWRPIRLELAFGLRERQGRDAASSVSPAPLDCGIQLRGSIDAVEEAPSGAIRITDFKTGKDRTGKDLMVDGGATLQPLLYALAAEKLFPGKSVESGRLYFCTSAGEFAEKVVSLDSRGRKAIEFVADTIEEAVGSGFFPAAPSDDRACEWCDYLSVCGSGEPHRVRRKPKDRLADLLKLRELE